MIGAAKYRLGNWMRATGEALMGLGLPLKHSDTVTQQQVLEFCRLFAPHDGVEGFRKTRIGRDRDGGYIFIDDFAPVAAIVSCGIAKEVSCDLAFAQMGKTVLQFDHSVKGPPVPHDNFRFRRQAIDARGKIPGAITLADALAGAGDPAKADLLLKMDIEGEEWPTFAASPPPAFARLRQIVCEFHWMARLGDPGFHAQALKAIKNLRSTFDPVHLHANNYGRFANVMGVPVPEFFEVTFVNRTLYRAMGRPSAGGALDRANNPRMPDLYLGSPFNFSEL